MNDIFLSRLRLAIVAELLEVETVSFSDLQRATGATKGNLGAHLAKLAGAGYVAEKRHAAARRPQTLYHLTAPGRAAFLAHIREHVKVLEDLLQTAHRERSEIDPAPLRPPTLEHRP